MKILASSSQWIQVTPVDKNYQTTSQPFLDQLLWWFQISKLSVRSNWWQKASSLTKSCQRRLQPFTKSWADNFPSSLTMIILCVQSRLFSGTQDVLSAALPSLEAVITRMRLSLSLRQSETWTCLVSSLKMFCSSTIFSLIFLQDAMSLMLTWTTCRLKLNRPWSGKDWC